jgi:hypothetical protein
VRTIIASVIASVVLLASTAPASAAIWTAVGSGTTETITALDHRSDKTVFGTANGKIFTLAGGQRASFPGLSVIDLKLNPAGTVGVAVLTGGKVTRSADGGTTWGAATQLQTYNSTFDCSSSGGPFGLSSLTDDPTAVAWASDTIAYLSSNLRGSMQRTTNGGSTWSEFSRAASGLCKFDSGSSDPITDIAPVTGSDSVYFISQSFGGTYFTSDGLTSSPADRGGSVNCFDKKPSLAVDTTNSSRLVAGDRCPSSLSLQYSEDGSTTYNRTRLVPDDNVGVKGIYDVSFTGGTALWVGNSGDIFTSTDGRSAYVQRADGVDATRDWRAVSAYSVVNAAVGGVGGALVVTTAANTIPDLVPPAGTISGPVKVTAGQPATYTANVADNAGGSGIDPASFQWSATGVPGATGNPAVLTFPSTGFYSVKVTFRDLAGNSGEATLGVTVGAAQPRPSASGGTRTRTTTVPGGSITLSGPRACVPAGGSFSATLAFKRSRKKGSKTVKVTRVDFFINGTLRKTDRRAPFRQTLTARNLAAGSRHTLRARATIKVRRGKSPKKSVSTTFTVCG